MVSKTEAATSAISISNTAHLGKYRIFRRSKEESLAEKI
jgi:hypothetical protein